MIVSGSGNCLLGGGEGSEREAAEAGGGAVAAVSVAPVAGDAGFAVDVLVAARGPAGVDDPVGAVAPVWAGRGAGAFVPLEVADVAAAA